MRGMDLFCVSQAATSVHLTSTDAPASSSSSSSTVHLSSSRLIDRHNPIITDSSRATPKHPPSAPNSAPLTPKDDNTNKGKKKKKKKSGSSDFVSTISCAKGGGFISPSGSTRFLLGERTGFLEVEPDFEPAIPVLPTEHTDKTETEKKLDVKTDSILDQASSSSRSSNQVVVLRVSLHCKGCAGKVKKHISRMRGVTSFNIDFAAKKVTVVGDVTPLEVLASISKVKTAQLWTPPKPPPLPPINPSTHSAINKSKAIVA